MVVMGPYLRRETVAGSMLVQVVTVVHHFPAFPLAHGAFCASALLSLAD
jgi:hypothetical protein